MFHFIFAREVPFHIGNIFTRQIPSHIMNFVCPHSTARLYWCVSLSRTSSIKNLNDVVASVTKNLNEVNAPNIKKITRKVTYTVIA